MQLRSGLRSAAKSAAFGGILLVSYFLWKGEGPFARITIFNLNNRNHGLYRYHGLHFSIQAMIEGLGIALGRLASPPPPGVPQGLGGPMPGVYLISLSTVTSANYRIPFLVNNSSIFNFRTNGRISCTWT